MRVSLWVAGLQLVTATIARGALLFQARHDVTWDASLFGAFAIGFGYDLLASVYVAVPAALFAWLMPGIVWRKAGFATAAAFVAISAVLLAFVAVAEWFFWDEFQVRFNFIAVDYLVYTQEVVDNIKQSYPMPAVFGGLALAAGLAVYLAYRSGSLRWIQAVPSLWQQRAASLVGIGIMGTVISYVFSQAQIPAFANQYNRELAKNGIYSFCAAFWENEIDYERFYKKLPVEVALARAKALLCSADEVPLTDQPLDMRRKIERAGPEHRWNVVLISVESLSHEFLAGRNGHELTPHVNRLRKEGIDFTNLRATGTRTVRGLEALTLCVPPTPGQSIVWRPRNEKLFSTGALFRARGYDTAYLYGGDAIFDNMRYFFSNNGYRVVDRQAKTRDDITFQNAWGVCDEDLFRWATAEADADTAKGQPFFLHVMTVSNHRPFTFPTGGIGMACGTRDAAVAYTDHAIGQFIEQARSKPWFENTVFAVIADHCHSSAGKSLLDVTKYHIPCFIWNPKLVAARTVDTLCSQIDLMPTVAGLLNWSYTTTFFGHDLLATGAARLQPRAFVSNYQKICLLRDGHLATLMPKQQFVLGQVDLRNGQLTPIAANAQTELLDDTIALYQAAAWMFKNGHLAYEDAAR